MEDEQTIKYCVYYDKNSEEIVDFFPSDIHSDVRNKIIAVWKQPIPRKILKVVSEGTINMQELRKMIGHSNSTLHENIKKLEDLEIISTHITYEGNKIRLLEPRFLFVTKSPRFRARVQKFFQGLWVNSKANEAVISFLKANPKDYFTAEEIAAKTSLSVDEVNLVLSNWDSKVTRALSDFLKKKPFEKRVLYKASK